MNLDLGGLKRGIEKGLRYDRDIFGLLQWAIRTSNHDAKVDCLAVIDQWTQEYDAIKANPTLALLTGDPFSGSRALAQDALAKWGKH